MCVRERRCVCVGGEKVVCVRVVGSVSVRVRCV